MTGSHLTPVQAQDVHLQSCHVCGQVCHPLRHKACRCPRCGARIKGGAHPLSRRITWALLLTAMVLYIPANIIPVMYTSSLFGGQDNTIMGGVVTFWNSGSWDLALIIFFASVAVPVLKFVALIYLLVASHFPSNIKRARQQTKLYHIVEQIGHWSMLDVFVVALLTGAVQLQPFASIRPLWGITWFALVVIMTMLASMSFDSRLLWSNIKES